MAGSSASLNDKAWLEIKPGTLVIEPIRESALVLPSRDGPLQCDQAMISAVLIDGQEIHLQAMGSEVAYSPARGSSGILIHFCHDPDESDKDAQEYCHVVLASNQVVLERSATTGAVRKPAAGASSGTKAVPRKQALSSLKLDTSSGVLQKTDYAKVQQLRLTTPAEREALEEGYYMTVEGKHYWAASAIGPSAADAAAAAAAAARSDDESEQGEEEGEESEGEEEEGEEEEEEEGEEEGDDDESDDIAHGDARCAQNKSLLEYRREVLAKSAIDRASELSSDYLRYMRRTVIDQVKRKGKRADDERRVLEAGYAAMATLMAEHFVLYSTRYEPNEAQIAAIKAAGSEIELDLPQELRCAVFNEGDVSSKLKPAPPSAPKPTRAAAAASSSGRSNGRGSVSGSRGSGGGGRGRRKVAVNRQLVPEPFAAQHAAQQQADRDERFAALQDECDALLETRRREFATLKKWGEAGWQQRNQALEFLKGSNQKHFASNQTFFPDIKPPFAEEMMSPPAVPRVGERRSPRGARSSVSVEPMQPLGGEGSKKKRAKKR